MDSFNIQKSNTVPYNETDYLLAFIGFDDRVDADDEFNLSQPVNENGDVTLSNEGEDISVTPPGLSELSYNMTLYYETDVWGKAENVTCSRL